MPKLRGRRHRWDREGETAICTNCGLKVEARLIRRGGLPICYKAIESEPQQISILGSIERAKSYFQEFIDSYCKGYERYGIWWILFTFSILAFEAVSIAVVITLVVLFL